MSKNPILFYNDRDNASHEYANKLKSVYSNIIIKPMYMQDKVQLVDMNNKLHQGYTNVDLIFPIIQTISGEYTSPKKTKIIILWATIRPDMFKKTHEYWMGTASSVNDIITLVAVDTQTQADQLKNYDVMITNNTTPGVCYPCYCLSASFIANPNDIIIYASDDFFPPQNWDVFIRNQMQGKLNTVLVVNDGIQSYGTNVITIPIMTYSALASLNHTIYHPAYTHMHTDVELYDLSKRMGMLEDIRNTSPVIFEHRHHSTNKRVIDVHDTNLISTYSNGEQLYNSRKCMPINELLIVNQSIIDKVNSIPNYIIRDFTSKSPKLSILICTMPSRKHFLDRLMITLNKQLTNDVEILIESDDGSMKIGKKRNILLDKAIGDYVCFVDDDDLVSDDYVTKILEATNSNPDCCSLEGLYTVNGENPTLFRHSLQYTQWETAQEDGNTVYYRCPNHLNTIKRDIALSIRFDDTKSNGEDKDFSDRIRSHLHNEYIINGIIYHYLYLQVQKGY